MVIACCVLILEQSNASERPVAVSCTGVYGMGSCSTRDLGTPVELASGHSLALFSNTLQRHHAGDSTRRGDSKARIPSPVSQDFNGTGRQAALLLPTSERFGLRVERLSFPATLQLSFVKRPNVLNRP